MNASQTPLSLQDFRILRKIATGGFGEVYTAVLTDPRSGEERNVILKKAKEFGEAEVRLDWRDGEALFETRSMEPALRNGDGNASAVWIPFAHRALSMVTSPH